jgi:site-specific DNA recombinase
LRTVIYARFSSDNQNPRSLADQIALCRERAEREGWPVVAVFEDAAISGAAGIGEDQRPGLNAMLRLVEAGGIDQVLAESTDRVTRHVADAHLVRERIEYAGARLFTLFDGTVTPMIGLVKGFMDAQFRTDLAARVKRGQRGTIEQGRAAGGCLTAIAAPTGSTIAATSSPACARSIRSTPRSFAASLPSMPPASARPRSQAS